jgi:endonuclease YncB( thermonuclease family)
MSLFVESCLQRSFAYLHLVCHARQVLSLEIPSFWKLFSQIVTATAACILLAVHLLIEPAIADPRLEARPEVYDGDSLIFSEMETRLEHIDAPELDQPCWRYGRRWRAGLDSAAFLSGLVTSGRLECTSKGWDRYHRPLVECLVNGEEIGRIMVKEGMAFAFCADPPECKRYSGRYLPEEAEAREARRGIWQGHCEKPWLYRRKAGYGAKSRPGKAK